MVWDRPLAHNTILHTNTILQHKTACQNNVDTKSIWPISSRTSQYCMQFV